MKAKQQFQKSSTIVPHILMRELTGNENWKDGFPSCALLECPPDDPSLMATIYALMRCGMSTYRRGHGGFGMRDLNCYGGEDYIDVHADIMTPGRKATWYVPPDIRNGGEVMITFGELCASKTNESLRIIMDFSGGYLKVRANDFKHYYAEGYEAFKELLAQSWMQFGRDRDALMRGGQTEPKPEPVVQQQTQQSLPKPKVL